MSTAGPFGSHRVRPEDDFDQMAVAQWLHQHSDLPAARPQVWQFGGGASNLTYLMQYPNRDVVLRMPPVAAAAGAHNMGREYLIQSRLAEVYDRVPQMLAHAPAPESPIGREFYAMAHVRGVIARKELPAHWQTPALGAALGQAFVADLAALHQVDIGAAGLAELYRGPGYVARQVAGWSKRYRAARTEDVPDGEDLMQWLAAHQPQDVGACLIHGDWRLDNVVLDAETATPLAVLDWELATVGDPLMDLGSAMAYWVQADDDQIFQAFRRQPSNSPGMPSRAEIVAQYHQLTGISTDDWLFYEVFGLFRLSVIAQQIWYRYRMGHTSNPAFSQFGAAVNYLHHRCEQLM